MKKIFIFIVLGIFLTSFVLAAPMTGSATDEEDKGNQIQTNTENKGEVEIEEAEKGNQIAESVKGQGKLTQSQVQNIIQEKNKFKANAGSLECPEGCTCTGVTIKCKLENGGREMTIQAGNSGNTIVQTKGVNASTEVVLYHHNNKTYGQFKNNETKEVKMMPDQVAEKVKEKLRQRDCDCENITLDEEGNYEIQAQKQAKLFGLFRVREKVRMEYDSNTGELVRQQNSWWGFLAKDEVDEELLGASCGTVTPGQNDECCQNKGYDFWNSEKGECVFVE